MSCSYVFHYIVERGITFLCLADEKQKRRIPFMFLDDVKGKFQQTYGDRASTAIAFAMNAEFARVLQDRMVSSTSISRRPSKIHHPTRFCAAEAVADGSGCHNLQSEIPAMMLRLRRLRGRC